MRISDMPSLKRGIWRKASQRPQAYTSDGNELSENPPKTAAQKPNNRDLATAKSGVLKSLVFGTLASSARTNLG
jgi:hypothetical protein